MQTSFLTVSAGNPLAFVTLCRVQASGRPGIKESVRGDYIDHPKYNRRGILLRLFQTRWSYFLTIRVADRLPVPSANPRERSSQHRVPARESVLARPSAPAESSAYRLRRFLSCPSLFLRRCGTARSHRYSGAARLVARGLCGVDGSVRLAFF